MDKGNPKRPRSKNNPNGKRKDPPVDWPKYNKRRSMEGKNRKAWFCRLAGEARRQLGVPPGVRDVRVSAILCAIIKSENNYSYWGLYNHFKKHPDDVELCELKKKYCRSRYHLRISGIDPGVLQRLITWSAGEDAKGTQLVDSSGYATYAYEDWYNAKYGLLDARSFVKLHIMAAPHGRIAAATVTGRHDGDSPEFAKLNEFLKPGEGYAVGDSAYISKDNCRARGREGTEADNAAQVKLHHTRVHRDGGHAEDGHRASRDVLQDGASAQQHRERLLVHQGEVRGNGARGRGAHARRRAALKGHRLQHDRLRIRRGRRPACRAGCARLSENRQDHAARLGRHGKSEESAMPATADPRTSSVKIVAFGTRPAAQQKI